MPETNDITRALATIRARQPRYQLYADYFNGNHRLQFATTKFRNTFGQLFQAFAANVCPVVVESVADRLEVRGFSVESGPDEAGERAWDIWQANRMDRRAGQVHLEALRSGDAYVIVWPDASGNPIIYPQAATGITVHYDTEAVDQINWAAKTWTTDDGYVRMNLYYPDRIEKYRTLQASQNPTLPTSGNAFTEFQPDTDTTWPLPNPWGEVPVFHFANNSDIGQWGRSELHNVIAIQDARNKTLTDMLVAMEFVALPQRWATGIEVPIDPETGKPVEPWKAGVDRIITTSNSDARFGEFTGANLTQFLEAADMWVLDVARVSRTPLHYLMASGDQWPSGESLKTAEAPFVAKVRDRQVSYGNVWESVMMFANRIANAPEGRLSAVWNDPSPRSDRDHIDQLARKHVELEIPKLQVWREAGYSSDEIKRMETESVATDERYGGRLMRAAAAGGIDREV